jgi:putative ABC transport system substrate-binding protein
MKRREFFTLLGAAATAPLAARRARAQPGMRRVAVMLGFGQGDEEGQNRIAAFIDALSRLGWSDRRNMRLDIRWAGGDLGRYKAVAAEVLAASPDAIVAGGNPFVTQL